MLLIGPPGTGKSHLAAAIGLALIEHGFRVLFTRTTDLTQRLQRARRDLTLEAAIAKLDKHHLLILDDFAYVTKDQAETSVLFELIAAESIRLDQGRAAAHERVGDAPAEQVIAGKERVLQWAGSELGEQEAAEQRAGTARKPLVHPDDRTVVLLYLLLPQRQAGDHGNVEVAFDAHPGCRSSSTRSGVMGASRRRSAPGRNAFIALRMAKNRPMPYIRGGSPTALAPSGP